MPLPRTARENLDLRLWLAGMLRDANPYAVGGLTALMLLRSLLPAATALATVALIDAIEAGPQHSLVFPLVAVGAVLLVGQACTNYVRALATLVSRQIDAAHRSRLMALSLSAPTVEPLESDDVQNLIRTARAESEHWVEIRPGDGAVSVLDAVNWVGLATSALVVARWAWWLVPVLVVPALIAREVERRVWVRHFRIWVRGIVHHRRYVYWAEQTGRPEAAKELRIFGFGSWLIDEHQGHLHGHMDDVWSDDLRAVRDKWRVAALTAVPLATVYVVVGLGATRGTGSLALLSAVLGAAMSVFTTMPGIGGLLDFEGSRPVKAATDELSGLLAAPAAPAPTAPAPTGPSPTGPSPTGPSPTATKPESADDGAPPLVRFEGITFGYRTSTRPVLHDLDLELRPGELLAIVGVNGAGKSTLTKLLAGLYEPASGRITADGRDLREIGLDSWRRRLTVVQQDFVRYQLSLTENVALGKVTGDAATASAWPNESDVDGAVDDAGLAPVAAGLPAGDRTPLTRSRTGGVDLSGGQWQQVALARGLYATRSGARILVLDEPTAHLDVRTEAELFDRLADITRDVTTVLISHRLSTVRRADRIVLLDGGRITEQGTHEELMRSGGIYARMFTLQAERFQRGFDDRIEEGELQ